MSKPCTKCKLNKELTEFNKDRQKKDGLASVCRECSRLACHEYYMKSSDTTRRNKNRQGMSQYDVNKYMAVWRTENSVRVKNIRDKWAVNNVHKIRHKNARRYAAKVDRTPLWLSPADKAEIDAMYLFCQVFKGFEVDHIVPLKGKIVSGLHVPWNLQVIPAELNRAKSNKF